MEISEHDRKVVEESWKDLHRKAREREAIIIQRIANLEAENKELMKRIEDLDKICQYQHALITISLPV